MSRAEGKENLQGDIPKSLHSELVGWTAEHKANSKRQCLQASVELWLKLPDPIKALTLVCHRDSPIFTKLAEEIGSRLAPVASLFLTEETLDARRQFEQIRRIAEALRPVAYAELTGVQSEIIDHILSLFHQLSDQQPEIVPKESFQLLPNSPTAEEAEWRRRHGEPGGETIPGKKSKRKAS